MSIFDVDADEFAWDRTLVCPTQSLADQMYDALEAEGNVGVRVLVNRHVDEGVALIISDEAMEALARATFDFDVSSDIRFASPSDYERCVRGMSLVRGMGQLRVEMTGS